MGTKWKVRDGVETRQGARGTKHRARIKVLGKQINGPWREDRQHAVEDRDRMRHERHTEEARPRDSITLERGMALVLQDLEAREKRPATIQDRFDRFTTLGRLMDTSARLDDITPRDIEDFVRVRRKGIPDELRACSLATALADIRALNTVFTAAMRDGLARENPIKRARLAKPDKHPDIDWFSPEELADLLAAMRDWPGNGKLDPNRDAEMVELLALTGWRLSEASAVTMRDVSIPRGTAVLERGKTGRRTHRLNTRATAIIKSWKADRPKGSLFPLQLAGIATALRRWSERLDEPRLHAHALRHTHGTALAAAGVSAHALAKSMGHSSLSTALIYVHLAGKTEEAVEQLDFTRGGRGAAGGKRAKKRGP